MAKIKFDVKGVESGQDFDTPVPVGVYPCIIAEAEDRVSESSGNDMLAVTYEITEGDFKGRKLWDYIVWQDSQAWKQRQFLEAIGLVKDGKETGTLDTGNLEGIEVRVRTKLETDKDYGTRAKVGMVLAAEGGAVSKKGSASADDLETSDDDGDDDDGELTYADLQEYDRDDLIEVIEENDLEDDVSYNAKTKVSVLRERIAEALELEPDDDDGDDDGDGDGDDDVDYDDMSLADLKAELSERGLKTSGTKKALIKRLEKDDEDDDGDEPF